MGYGKLLTLAAAAAAALAANVPPADAQMKFPPPDNAILLRLPEEVRGGVASLYSPDPVVRVRGAFSLLRMGPGAAPALIHIMSMLSYGTGIEPKYEAFPMPDDPDDVAKLFSRFGDPTADSLVAFLADEDRYARRMAAWALGEMKDPSAVVPLISRLEDNDRGVRWWAAFALGNIKDARAVDPLISALRHKDPRLREMAARALGEIGDARAVDPLLAALDDASLDVVRTAQIALGKIGDTRALDPLIAANAIGAIGYFRDPRAVDYLVAVLEREGASNAQKYEAAAGLGNIGDARGVEPLLRALSATDTNLQFHAQVSLAQIGTPAAVEAVVSRILKSRSTGVLEKLKPVKNPLFVEYLIPALKDGDTGRRYSAALVLKDFPDPRAVSALADGLKDKEASVRTRAANSLGELKDSAAVAPLLLAMKDANASVVEAAVGALGMIRDPRAFAPLVEGLKDPRAPVRAASAWALGRMGDRRAVAPLRDASKDGDAKVRKMVETSLGRLEESPK